MEVFSHSTIESCVFKSSVKNMTCYVPVWRHDVNNFRYKLVPVFKVTGKSIKCITGVTRDISKSIIYYYVVIMSYNLHYLIMYDWL